MLSHSESVANIINDEAEFSPLYHLAVRHGTDKGPRHHYTEVYYDLFKHRINSVRGVFEFGIKRGASLRMWKEFFPNAIIFGMDFKEHALFQEERIETYLCNQVDINGVRSLLTLACAKRPLDFIVDDGSHRWDIQLSTARAALPFLAKGGVYIIEDINSDRGVDDPRDLHKRFPDYNAKLIRTTPGIDSVLLVITHKGLQ